MNRNTCVVSLLVAGLFLISHAGPAQETIELRGSVVDAKTGESLASRVYLQSADGKRFFVKSDDSSGSAVEYRKERGPRSVEVHTTLSAHPFVTTVPPGKYTITVERGKEYFPHTQELELGGTAKTIRIPLKRWSDMASLKWYSGETHVHRSIEELPTAMLADDLNVALPLTYWVTQSDTPPSRGNKNSPDVPAKLTKVDSTHVFYPMNTEYEIFTVGGKQHTLGAVFGLNHKRVLSLAVPPVKPVAEFIHAEGGILELDKHNWPWSMMLIPVMNVDLYELTNNHVWRTEFSFGGWGEQPPSHWSIERDERGFTERGWLDFTWQNYYLLLNCGFRLRPTAGTASGVHPVPLGWGRVYVHLPDGFSYEAWMKGLNAGRSFVSTGPMLLVTFNGKPPGETFAMESNSSDARQCRIRGVARSVHRHIAVEIISHEGVTRQIAPASAPNSDGVWETQIDETVQVKGSEWFAVRCLERNSEGRLRFAHSAPVFFDHPSHPIRPKREDVDYLITRMKSELARNAGVLSDAGLLEYREALSVYEEIARHAE